MSIPYQRRPCSECPWRRDAPPGRFEPERFEKLRDTVRQPDPDAIAQWSRDCDAAVAAGELLPPIQPMFACHKTGNHEGTTTVACAGFLASDSASENIAVRIALTQGALPRDVLTTGGDWPDLYTDYEDMARVNGARPEEEDRK